MRTKVVRLVMKCSPKKKGRKLSGFEVWASINSKGFGDSQKERRVEVMCAKRALETAAANLARCVNMPVEEFMKNFTDEVIRIYCQPEKFVKE